MLSYHPIDFFLVGVSVLLGMGVPSVFELLRAQMPLRMLILSILAYLARQMIIALIVFVFSLLLLCLIVDFLVGHDLWEEIRNYVCESMGDFRCRYNAPEVRRRLAQDPVYRTIFDVGADSTDIFATFANAATHNLTLATTRYLLDQLKGTIK